jgi:hypothetical protein
MSLLIALLLQAAATAGQPAPAPTQDPAAVSGVVVESPQTQKKPKTVYTAPYKAAPHLSSGSVVSAPNGADALFTDPRFQTSLMGPYMVSSLAAQRHRAKKAAELINAGRCPDALQAVFNEGDQYLAYRIAQVCDLPAPVAHRTTPF